MSKVTTEHLTLTPGDIVDGELTMEVIVDHPELETQEQAYVDACAFRGDLLGAMTRSIATHAVTEFSDNEDTKVVTGSTNFGNSVLSSTVYREFEGISNHVVISCEDDFSDIIDEALDGIFDETEADVE